MLNANRRFFMLSCPANYSLKLHLPLQLQSKTNQQYKMQNTRLFGRANAIVCSCNYLT